MNIAIIGSRNSGNLTIKDIIKYIPKECSCIISGGAIGVDSLAKQTALKLNIPIKEFLPNYELFGKIAPIQRNIEIVNNSDQVIAFWDYKSRGTRHTILECLKQDKPVKVVIIDEDK